MFFFDDSEKTLRNLLEALSKGIDLLANDSVDANLYTAYEKYVISTIKLVDNAYLKNYTSRFEQKNPLEQYPFMAPPMPTYSRIYDPHQPLQRHNLLGDLGIQQQFGLNPQPIDYKEKVRALLQKITTVVKELTTE